MIDALLQSYKLICVPLLECGIEVMTEAQAFCLLPYELTIVAH